MRLPNKESHPELYHLVISLAVSPSHNSGALNIVLIFSPGDDIVQKVPVPRSRMHPGNFKGFSMRKDSVGDDQSIF